MQRLVERQEQLQRLHELAQGFEKRCDGMYIYGLQREELGNPDSGSGGSHSPTMR